MSEPEHVARFRARCAGLRHFTAAELLFPGARSRSGACKGLNDLPGPRECANLLRIARAADEIRARLGSPLKVISGFRSAAYNRCIGGASQSLHMQGLALDLAPVSASVAELWEVARQARRDGVFFGGIGRYGSFVHVDARGYLADWTS